MKKIIAGFMAVVLIFILPGCSKKENISAEPKKETEVINETITLVAVGDNLLHMPVVRSGRQADGSYEFSHIFENLQPIFKESDIAVINQETMFGGDHLGYCGYPRFNSPSDMGKTLVNEGFDVVLHASNHALDKKAEGVENTLMFWERYPEVTVLGINRSEEEKNQVDILEVKGAKIAVLNYTYGTNGFSLPEEKSYLVNYIDEEKIQKDAAISEKNADFTIAFMHWGTEYATKPDSSQTELCKKMCEWGIDLVIGAHPHVIQTVEWYNCEENGNDMLVYYSLGNFVSRQMKARCLLGGIADVKLKFDGKKVCIGEYNFVPIVTHYNRNYTDFDVYRLADYNDELARTHGVSGSDGAVSVERWKKILSDVFIGDAIFCVK